MGSLFSIAPFSNIFLLPSSHLASRSKKSSKRLSDDDSDGLPVQTEGFQPVSSSSSTVPNEELTEEKSQDLLFQYVDELEDRTAEKRLKALQQCSAMIALHFIPDAVLNFRSTLLSAVENSLKRGGAPEKVSAFNLLKLVVLSLGTSSTDIYPSFRPSILRLLKDNDEDLSVRSAAAEALALLSFVCEESSDSCHDDIAVLYSLFEAPEPLSVAAVGGWSLLITILNAKTIIERYVEDALTLLFEMLTRTPLATSIAVGEAIALLYETVRDIEDYDLEDLPVDKTELLQALDGLVNERTRRKSKSDQVDQRKISASIESDTAPTIDIVVNKQQLVFNSWEQITQLNALRSALRTGFHIHLQYNDLLHEIFDVRIQKEHSTHKLTRLEKRQFCSKNSAASKDRTSSRDQARAKKLVR